MKEQGEQVDRLRWILKKKGERMKQIRRGRVESQGCKKGIYSQWRAGIIINIYSLRATADTKHMSQFSLGTPSVCLQYNTMR